MTHAYHAFFCEENIWQLAGDAQFLDSPRAFVMLVSNDDQTCPLWHQRAAQAPGEPVVWDYHVVLLDVREQEHPVVWDLDTVLPGPPTAFEHWWTQTFPLRLALPDALNPMFRVLSAKAYRETFSSDRSHMKNAQGQWLAPPPPWAPIEPNSQRPHTLERLLQMRENGMPGTIHDHKSLEAWVLCRQAGR